MSYLLQRHVPADVAFSCTTCRPKHVVLTINSEKVKRLFVIDGYNEFH